MSSRRASTARPGVQLLLLRSVYPLQSRSQWQHADCSSPACNCMQWCSSSTWQAALSRVHLWHWMQCRSKGCGKLFSCSLLTAAHVVWLSQAHDRYSLHLCGHKGMYQERAGGTGRAQLELMAASSGHTYAQAGIWEPGQTWLWSTPAWQVCQQRCSSWRLPCCKTATRPSCWPAGACGLLHRCALPCAEQHQRCSEAADCRGPAGGGRLVACETDACTAS